MESHRSAACAHGVVAAAGNGPRLWIRRDTDFEPPDLSTSARIRVRGFVDRVTAKSMIAVSDAPAENCIVAVSSNESATNGVPSEEQSWSDHKTNLRTREESHSSPQQAARYFLSLSLAGGGAGTGFASCDGSGTGADGIRCAVGFGSSRGSGGGIRTGSVRVTGIWVA